MDGRKTQTRRVIKPQPASVTATAKDGWCFSHGEFGHKSIYCPYGQPGDRLWVRETWAPDVELGEERDGLSIYGVAYRERDENYLDEVKWRPSIHMPRWASRITLEVTDVRAERVQDISIDDILAEGIERDDSDSQYWRENTGHRFVELWNFINEKRGYSWASNPWVWVVEFKVVS